eukprot:gene9963-18579_t
MVSRDTESRKTRVPCTPKPRCPEWMWREFQHHNPLVQGNYRYQRPTRCCLEASGYTLQSSPSKTRKKSHTSEGKSQRSSRLDKVFKSYAIDLIAEEEANAALMNRPRKDSLSFVPPKPRQEVKKNSKAASLSGSKESSTRKAYNNSNVPVAELTSESTLATNRKHVSHVQDTTAWLVILDMVRRSNHGRNSYRIHVQKVVNTNQGKAVDCEVMSCREEMAIAVRLNMKGRECAHLLLVNYAYFPKNIDLDENRLLELEDLAINSEEEIMTRDESEEIGRSAGDDDLELDTILYPPKSEKIPFPPPAHLKTLNPSESTVIYCVDCNDIYQTKMTNTRTM